MILSVPSKTFLAGEYAVLAGGPGLVVNTHPGFELHIKFNGRGFHQGFHRDSPAGKWIQYHPIDFQDIDLHFVDPHGGRGGFGASTAQFLSLYTWSQFKKSNTSIDLNTFIHAMGSKESYMKNLWKEYRTLSWNGEGARPSGADLLGQYLGGVSFFSSQPFLNQTLCWPFESHGFFIVPTHHQLATHEHLKTKKESEFTSLKPLSEAVVKAFRQKNWFDFISAQKEFYGCLNQMGLTLSANWIQKVRDKGIDFVKPCGALGSEVLMVFFERSYRKKVEIHLESLGFTVVSSDRELCRGLYFSMDLPLISRRVQGVHYA